MNKDSIIAVRHAIVDDSLDLWHWRNDDLTRKMAINNDYIDYQNHKEWFNNRINSDDCKIYIGIYQDNKIGMVRFDLIENDSAKVSINLNYEFRGMKLSEDLLRVSIREFIKKKKIKLIAEIIPENIASTKIFERNNFVFKKTEDNIMTYTLNP